MKKTFLFFALFCLAFSSSNGVKAQVSVNININSQPNWGPRGYDYVEYYYLPDIEAYYYVPRQQFVYISGGNWVFSAHLPARYRNYDLYRGYKVVVNEPRAYHHYHHHKVKYKKYKGHRGDYYRKSAKHAGHNGNKGHKHHKGHGKGHRD